jgi:hypothetical protein
MQQTVQLPQSLPVGALSLIARSRVFQRAAFVSGDVIAFIAFDFILGFIARGVMRVTFIVEVPDMNGDDLSRDMTGLGVPSHMIADLESLGHRVSSISAHYTPGSPDKTARNFIVKCARRIKACPAFSFCHDAHGRGAMT